MKRYYITTPIYYVNDKPHIGHAYTTLACDISARFKRLDGFDVFFLTGTDEHGQKIENSAKNMKVDPRRFTNMFSQVFRNLLVTMQFSNDDFIRTSENRHKKACRALWQRLKENGQIYLGMYAGWYAVRDEAYYTSEEIVEVDGVKVAPTGAEVQWVEESSYFFSLSKWQEKLLQFYEENEDFIAPKSRLNEVKSFVASGLRDLSISRTTFSWGIPVDDDRSPIGEKHVMYVWLDALANYLTAVGYPNVESATFQKYWQPNLHMVGKDILRFHAVYWPAFLMAADLPLPKRIFSHGWWTNDGKKISKSVGNVIDPVQLVEKYGINRVRYFLMREVPFGGDGDFSDVAIVRRTNADLANDLGNFCQRCLSMIAKNCDFVVPKANLTVVDRALLDYSEEVLVNMRSHLDSQAYDKALKDIWNFVSKANFYVDDQAPWMLRKIDKKRMETVLYTTADTIRRLGILLQPFIPDGAHKMLDAVAVTSNERTFAHLGHMLQAGTLLPKPYSLFPRYAHS